jgi:hypothetical protein
MKTLAEINTALASVGIDPADLTAIIADIKTSVLADQEAAFAKKQTEWDATFADFEAKLKTAGDALKSEQDATAAAQAALATANANAATQLAAMTAERDSLIGLREEDHTRSVGYVDAAKAHVQGLVAVLTEAAMTTEALKAAKDAAETARLRAELEAKLAALPASQ